jgi:hypothetical protein
MIETTKNSLRDSSHYFLLWGWSAFLACITQYILKVWVHYPQYYNVWLIIPLILGIHIFWVIRDRKRDKVRTFIDQAGTYLWTSIGLSYFALAFVNSQIGWNHSYFFYSILYGIGTYVSGSLIKFKPLIIGGISCFVITIISTFLEPDYQILMLALALATSYLIPGYLLRYKFKKQGQNV